MEIKEVSGHYHLTLYGKPISKVQVVGIISGVDKKAKRITYHIDDGTGIIRLVQFLNTSDPTFVEPSFFAGDLVSAKGYLAISETNTEPAGVCIHLDVIEYCEEPNTELWHWARCMYLVKHEYMK